MEWKFPVGIFEKFGYTLQKCSFFQALLLKDAEHPFATESKL